MIEKLKAAHGNWVSGEQFWDRKEDLRLFVERIDEGANQLLVAQRRMGKTSLLQETARLLADRYRCVFVDLEKCFSAEDAIVELNVAVKGDKSILRRIGSLFSNVMSNVEEIGISEFKISLRQGMAGGNWKEKGDGFFDVLADMDKPALVLIDELPILVNRLLKGSDFKITPERREAADEFMSWLRSNAQRHQGKIRIVLSGSIGLEPILQQARLSAAINNFQPFELKPWDEDASIACINALANQYDIELETDAAREMIRKLGSCIPHHVQMFFGHVRDLCVRRDGMTFKSGEVKGLYKTEMLGTRGHAELTHYEDRLKQVLGDESFTFALDMLTQAAVKKSLTDSALAAFHLEYQFGARATAEVQKEILQVLEHDGYFVRKRKGYAFVSFLLRDWWKARHGTGFVPVEDREL